MAYAHSTKAVEMSGVKYKVDAVVAIKPATEFEEPTFGKIKEIYVVQSSVYFYIQSLDTLEYSEHYFTYVTTSTLTFTMVSIGFAH